MKRCVCYAPFLLLLVSLLAGGMPSSTAAAQQTPPPPLEFVVDPFGEGRVREMELVVVEPNPAGAVDNYGYRVSQAAYSWEDIKDTGTVASISHVDSGYSDEVELGWDFK